MLDGFLALRWGDFAFFSLDSAERDRERDFAFLEPAGRDRERDFAFTDPAFSTERDRERDFAFLEPPYEYETKHKPFDILAGSDELRNQLTAQHALKDLAASWEKGCEEFQDRKNSYALYA